jgi:small subunit ribosomal protein S4
MAETKTETKKSKTKKASCKICRRIGEKLFLKGEKCESPKCPLLKKPYPPGRKGKTLVRRLTEYGEELREVQKLKKSYLLEAKHFKKIVKEVLKERGKIDVSELLLKRLERKAFNVLYRAQIASSRAQGKQLISHGHFYLNGKKLTIPTYEVKIGDELTLTPSSQNKTFFKNILLTMDKSKIPSWLSFDPKNWKIKVIQDPDVETLKTKYNTSLIFAFYSR